MTAFLPPRSAAYKEGPRNSPELPSQGHPQVGGHRSPTPGGSRLPREPEEQAQVLRQRQPATDGADLAEGGGAPAHLEGPVRRPEGTCRGRGGRGREDREGEGIGDDDGGG